MKKHHDSSLKLHAVLKPLGLMILTTFLTCGHAYGEQQQSSPGPESAASQKSDNTVSDSKVTQEPAKSISNVTLPKDTVSQNPLDTISAVIAMPSLVPESHSDEQAQLPDDNDVPKTLPGRISFSFQNVAVKTLLQLIGKNSGLNFIISESIKGNATLELKNVTWKQALDIVMQSNGLASKQIGTALFISTVDEISQLQAKEYQAAQNAISMAPLSSALIALKYSDATAIAKVLKSQDGSLLTERGEVSVNNPTNSIIVRDVASNILEVKKYIRKLDVPARQVSIEARIVNIDAFYEGQIGVRFGVSNDKSISGTLAGANQLRQGVAPSAITPLDRRLNFNIPANVLSTNASPASIGLALAKLGPVLLDLELSALEEEGHTQIVSKPRVVTANQQKAIILAGEEIPYQQSTSSGATSVEFKKAVLSLEIIPQITPDNKIILKLKANQDTRGQPLLIAQTQEVSGDGDAKTITTIPTVLGPPTINTQQVESQVLLNDNETVVIGGIYKLSKTNTLDRVPFFGSLPLIGSLFRHKGVRNQKSELLIFLTPKIIEQKPRQYAYKGE